MASVYRDDRVKTGHHALRLLSLLTFYHYDQITVQIFYNERNQIQTAHILEYVPRDFWVSDLFNYRQYAQPSINLLVSFSLITKNGDASLSLNPLVHEWCRSRISQDEQRARYRQALSLLLVQSSESFRTKILHSVDHWCLIYKSYFSYKVS